MSSKKIDYEAINKVNWNERAKPHAASPDYNFDQFLSDPSYISNVVQFDRPRLGDITGLNIVHLQSHISTDSISLARLGASKVTCLDFSSASLQEGRRLAEGTIGSGGEKLEFVEASVYSALEVLPAGSFDGVYQSVGSLCWIHSIKEWAKIVSGLLKPGGRFFIREGHPVLWTISDVSRDELVIQYPYFEREEPTVFEDPGTYAQTDAVFTSTTTAEFNHGLGEILQALIEEGMRITGIEEHQSVPWLAVPGQMIDIGNGEWQLKDKPFRMPHTYTLQCVKEKSQ